MSEFVPLGAGEFDHLITVANLSDSLDAEGLRNQVLPDYLAPVVSGARILGPARTARFEPTDVIDPEKPYDDAIDFIDGVQAGEVIVIATDGSNASGFWGELFSAAALGSHAAGTITDGNVRDTRQILDLGYPVYARSRRPIDFRGRMVLAEQSVDVQVGGVTISPADVVGADDDGVVVVPLSAVEAVLGAARKRASTETTVLRELLAGASLRQVWDKHRVL